MRKMLPLLLFLLLAPLAVADDCGNILHAHFESFHTLVVTSGDDDIARLQFTVNGADELFVADSWVKEESRRAGIMTKLYSEMLKKNPYAKKIEANLSLKNLEAFLEHATSDDYDALSFDRCRVLAQNTPAFKMNSRLGFKNVIVCRWYKNMIELVMER